MCVSFAQSLCSSQDEVLSQLKDHQQRVSEAENEKTALIEKVLKLEQMVSTMV